MNVVWARSESAEAQKDLRISRKKSEWRAFHRKTPERQGSCRPNILPTQKEIRDGPQP